MKTSTGSNYSQPPTSYPPSVPLYVYRELTVELQAVQSKLDVVTSHNQKLAQENQQLRQEITKVIQSCLELEKLVDASAPSSPTPTRNINQVKPPATPPNNEVKSQPEPQPIPRNNNEATYTNKPPVKPAPPRQAATRPPKKSVIKATHPQNRRQKSAAPNTGMNFPVSETVFIEEEEVRHYPHPKSQTKGLNGWWLMITILFMMVTGFAAGYLIVRPLLQNQSQPSTIKN